MRFYWLSIVIFLFVASCGQKENRDPKITPKIDSLVAASNFNGVILVAEKGRIVYHKAFGYANFETKQPLDTNSIFETGKMVIEIIAKARMRQQVEKAKNIDLIAFTKARLFVPMKMTSTDFRSHEDKLMLRNMAWSNVVDTTNSETLSSTTSDLFKWINKYDLSEVKRPYLISEYRGYSEQIAHYEEVKDTIIILSNKPNPASEQLLKGIEEIVANL